MRLKCKNNAKHVCQPFKWGQALRITENLKALRPSDK